MAAPGLETFRAVQDFPARVQTDATRRLIVPSLRAAEALRLVWIMPYLLAGNVETTVHELKTETAGDAHVDSPHIPFFPQAGSPLVTPQLYTDPPEEIIASLLVHWPGAGMLLPARVSAILSNYALVPTIDAYARVAGKVSSQLCCLQQKKTYPSFDAVFIEILLSPRTSTSAVMTILGEIAAVPDSIAGPIMLEQILIMFVEKAPVSRTATAVLAMAVKQPWAFRIAIQTLAMNPYPQATEVVVSVIADLESTLGAGTHNPDRYRDAGKALELARGTTGGGLDKMIDQAQKRLSAVRGAILLASGEVRPDRRRSQRNV